MNGKKNFWQIPANRICAMVLMDVMSTIVSSFFALYIRYDFSFAAMDMSFLERYCRILPIYTGIVLFFFVVFRLYKSVWKYAGATELIHIVFASSGAGLVQYWVCTVTNRNMPRSYYVICWILQMGSTCVLRFGYRISCVLKERRMFSSGGGVLGNADRQKDVKIEDLLGREPVKINSVEVFEYVRGKVVMVTGGGGSIGSELCRQIAAHSPKQIIILDNYENSAYEIEQELRRKYPRLNMQVLIATVRNSLRMEKIFEEYRPDIVYHAAAHKHVPLMETSPNEAIKNNVLGTLYTARAADKYGAEKFVLISTDKAVNPTNIMGASKRLCEMVVQGMSHCSRTNYVAVRFGNVLGSNGSVIPLFKKQIAEGGPVTVTHPEITRYFMTIQEAVALVLQAGAYAKGGEIFVLDMGEPVKIVDLAKNLIRLSGYRVGEDIPICFTGLRPGEKMYEELLINEEGIRKTANERIFIGRPIEMDEETFFRKLKRLGEAAENEEEDIRRLVKELVPSYHFREGKQV